MTNPEFKIPGPAELFRRISKSGRAPEQFSAMLETLNKGIENGVIRDHISCWENKELFLDIIRRTYDPSTKDTIRDAEAGIHTANCKSPTCMRVAKAYFERPGGAKSPEHLLEIGAEFVENLANELVRGQEMPELIGKPSRFIDSDTGLVLPVLNAVNIAHHCIDAKEEERQLLYVNPKKGMAVELKYGLFVLLPVSSLRTSYYEDLKIHAEGMKIDPDILLEIVLANAPQA